MMTDLYSIIYELQYNGVYEFVLPFLLVFTILFAILEKTFIFGKEGNKAKSNINVVVALVVSLMLIVQTDLVSLMNNYLSRMAFFMVIGIMFMLIYAMFSNEEFGGFGKASFAIAIVALIWSLSSGQYGQSIPYWYYISDSTISAILLIAVMVGAIALVVKGTNSGGSN